MTLQRHARTTHAATADVLDFPPQPKPDPTRLLDAALAAGATPAEFHFLMCAARRLPEQEYLLLDEFAEAAGLGSEVAARRIASRLVKLGLLGQTRRTVTVDGRRVERHLYLVAVTR